MKIEKINENQIRCTLTKEDLTDRHIKLSELAYGTEKAKTLFRDMMQQANYEFGFEVDDLPLMIEAIPVSSESIVLVITKVEYPDELDTRFSKFTDSSDDFEDSKKASAALLEGADDILGLFRKKISSADQARLTGKESKKVDSNKKNLSDETNTQEVREEDIDQEVLPLEEELAIPIDLTRMFSFHRLEIISRLSNILDSFYQGNNNLYKNTHNGTYYLVLHKDDLSPELFNKACNILSEYAHQEPMTIGTEAYFEEHLITICRKNALSTLAKLF